MSVEHTAIEPRSQGERLEALHRMAGVLTHDFNNLLGVILNSSETLAAELGEGAHRELALVGLKAAERGAELLKRLLALSHDREPGDELIDCAEALEGLRPLVRQAIPQGVSLKVLPAAEPMQVLADPVGLEIAMLNLCLNAGQATPVGGKVVVKVRPVTLDMIEAQALGVEAGSFAAFTVRDTGKGMSPETLARALEPLFTTREEGTGLGLPSVADFAASAGGGFSLGSQKGRGTVATLYLPIATEPERRKAIHA
jgi:signal transduction histidine kinase